MGLELNANRGRTGVNCINPAVAVAVNLSTMNAFVTMDMLEHIVNLKIVSQFMTLTMENA